MRQKLICAVITLLFAGAAIADWVETNNDGGIGALDYSEWVSIWNGSDPGPDTIWDTAANLGAAGFGYDPGWVGNVINISDADATVLVSENTVESFTDVSATVAVSTTDTDEEFGLMVHASDFNFYGAGIGDVTAYAATFNGNDGLNNQLEFNLYKIVNGTAVHTITAHPSIPAGYNDYIMFVELSIEDNNVSAKLFEDADMSNLLASLSYTDLYGDADGNPLLSGYTGVINLDGAVSDGLNSYWDTLTCTGIPEPATLLLLGIGGMLLRRRQS
ncbi:MAG: PEP-CTERM sorting domain-containing protein [Sedimentisphaerales bacterium]|nr:PEP-CTERM sorting domain-containing protein [Sedimentisphaerales bacterium]